jgi:hypothetical protein
MGETEARLTALETDVQELRERSGAYQHKLNDAGSRIDALMGAVQEISQGYGAMTRQFDLWKQEMAALGPKFASAAVDAANNARRYDDAVREEMRTSTAQLIGTMNGKLADLRSELKLELDDAMQQLVSEGGFAGRLARAVRAAWQELR